LHLKGKVSNEKISPPVSLKPQKRRFRGFKEIAKTVAAVFPKSH
jgi:hypothetical protein